MSKIVDNVVVFGGGAWGTALAKTISQNVEQVFIYLRDPELISEINQKHTNYAKLGSVELPKNIIAIDNFKSIKCISIGIVAIPVKALEQLFENINMETKLENLVICSKGIENKTLNFPSQICEKFFPNTNIAVLSGPNFAKEIAQQKFAKTLIASKNETLLQELKVIFDTFYFKTEVSTDVMGVEICGAVKNVIAIALGIAKGLDLGENFISALFVFALNELEKLVQSLGGSGATIYSLAGLGDLLLTSYSLTSRNTNFGFNIAMNKQKLNLNEIVVEGYYTAKSIYKIAKSLGIEMPICKYVYEVLYLDRDINEIVKVI